MVRLRLVEAGDMVTYDYYPESFDEKPGRVSVDARTRARALIFAAEADSTGAYRIHAWNRIDEMLDAGDLKPETYAAWY